MLKKIAGTTAAVIYASTIGRKTMDALAEDYVESLPDSVPNQRRLVIMMGFSMSGKTTLVQSHPALKHCARIETQVIHRMLNGRFSLLIDNQTIAGRGYWLRQGLTRILRQKILNQLLLKGVSIVIDSCNLRRSWRKSLIKMAKRDGYFVRIVHVDCDERVLQSRLEQADEKLKSRGLPPTWVALYRQQRAMFQPTRNEIVASRGDRYIVCTSDDVNFAI